MDIQEPETVKLETYQVLMAQNFLNQLGLDYSVEDLGPGIMNPDSKYALILRLPMKICLNSLIVGQIDSYKLFCQKRLIDYVVLTNPSEETQNSAEFVDKVPQDIEDQKNMLKAFQSEARDIYQNYYDMVANIWSFLRRSLKQNPELRFQDEFMRNMKEFEDELEKTKLIFLHLRQQIQDQARILVQILSEKSEFNLQTEDDEEEKLDLNFYHKLGQDYEASSLA